MSDQRNEANILLAIQALQTNPKLSVRRVAKIYNVPRCHRRTCLSSRHLFHKPCLPSPTKLWKMTPQQTASRPHVEFDLTVSFVMSAKCMSV
ncbi:uncharacterized protein F5Z01DRAFT_659796 [Emericellopsis atlantica]|uniref:HTH psq-type domain-containing protein n=1 Tax=Emericellopsis atlantica TaxID=2614577 RepID=A0A9P7ZJ22_9HYPO|nr:uncharacterized protein F5Z01DRAFT_659796 [Emericellopsis atlantica]KAG9252910.1 hypothetical protein F5Z01DRAFT_659796 [Emericellopsis atlantica]